VSVRSLRRQGFDDNGFSVLPTDGGRKRESIGSVRQGAIPTGPAWLLASVRLSARHDIIDRALAPAAAAAATGQQAMPHDEHMTTITGPLDPTLRTHVAAAAAAAAVCEMAFSR